MKVAAVVLDMDGVILDTEPIYKASWQQAAADLGYELDDPSYLKVVGRPNEDGERELVQMFGSGFPTAEFHARWSELWRLRVERAGIATKPGLLDFLSFLEAHHVPFAVATSSDRDYTELSLRRAGLEGRFGLLVTGDQIATGKPAPDIYLAAAERLGVDAAQCVALEDSDAGALAASRAGMVVVMIPDLKPPSAEARAAAFQVLASLDEARQLIATLMTP